MKVQYIDINRLTKEETTIFISLVDKYIKKLERTVPNAILILKIHTQKTAGKGKKYSLHAKLDNPNTIVKSKSFDWDIARVTHKILQQIEKQLKKKYKLEGQPQEKFHPINPKRGFRVKDEGRI